jgi:hypothetical protein
VQKKTIACFSISFINPWQEPLFKILRRQKMSLYKRITTCALAGLVGLAVAGCEMRNSNAEYAPEPEGKAKKIILHEDYFDNTGLISKTQIFSNSDIELADMDGDGDIDIVYMDYGRDEIRIIENRIPRANLNIVKEE